MKKKLLYGLAGLLFALSLTSFVACSDDDDDDGDSGGNAPAVYDTDESEDETTVFSSVTVTYNSSYVATKIAAKLGNETYTMSITNSWTSGDVTYYYSSFQTDDTIYYVYLYYSSGTWYYYYYSSSYIPYEASWGGDSTTETNALAGYTVTVYADEANVGWVEVTDGSTYYYPSTTTSDGVTTCSFSVDSTDDSTSTVYTLKITYDDDNDTYSYTYTSVAATNLTATYTGTGDSELSTVVVKYNSDSGIAAVSVNDDDDNVWSLTTTSATAATVYYYGEEYNDDGTYAYTTYYLTISVDTSESTPTASYSYTYDYKYSYDIYKASGGLSDYTVTIGATMYETFDGSSSTYELQWYWINAITDSDGNSYSSTGSDSTYTFTVEDDSSATIYTIKLAYTTTDGLAFTYTYTSATTTIYTATTTQTSIGTVLVYYDENNSSVEKVTVDGDEADYRGEDNGSYIYTWCDDDEVQYTLTISVASGTASYTLTTVSLSAVTSGDYAGYCVVNDYTLGETADEGGSGLSKMLTADQLDGVSEVVILFTCEDSAWFTIACTSDWRGKIDTALDDGTEGSYTLTLSSAGAYLVSGNTNTGAYQGYDKNLEWDTSYSSEGVDMVAFYRDNGGLWAAGGNCTVTAVYVKYGEDEE